MQGELSSNKTITYEGQNRKAQLYTQSGQERVVYDVCVLQKLAGIVLEVGTVGTEGRGKNKEEKNKG